MKTRKKASLTIEAALILPVFMMGLLTLVSVLFMWMVRMRIQASLLNITNDLSVTLANGYSIALSDIEDDLADSLNGEDYRYIEHGRDGLDMTGSNIDDGEYVKLSIRYRLIPLTDTFRLLGMNVSGKSFSHVWCGYDRPYYPEEEYVYITNDSEVYHRDRECSHIRLTIRETSPDEVGVLRNSSGGRYRPCEICHARPSDWTMYVTSDGDRYHNSITCSGLKRTVRAVKISETGGRRPCSRCGR